MTKKRDNSSKAELRRQAEAKLGERKEELARARAETDSLLHQYTDMFDFAPVGYFRLARDGTILQTNLTGADLLGVERGELIQQRFGSFVVAESLPTFNAFLEKLFSTSVSNETCEISLRKNGGDPLWARIEATIKDGQRETCLVVVEDITERKQAEEALEQSRRRFQAMLEKGAEGISLFDATGNMTYVSPAITRILGYAPAVFAGLQPFEIMHPDDLQNTVATAAPLLQTPGAGVSVQYRNRHKDGSWRWIESTVTNLLEDPNVQSIVVNYRDITKRKQAEEELQRRADQFAALYVTLLDITVTHDLLQLLNTIVERACKLLNVPIGGLYFCDDEKQEAVSMVGYNHPSRPARGFVLKYGEGAVGKVAATGQPLIVDDYFKWEGRSEKFPADHTTTVIAVPLIWQNQVIGVINAQAVNTPRHFSPHDLEILTLFAAQATIAIQNTRLYDEMRLAHAQLQTLARQLVEMQETERRNLALELHDHVLSDLAVFTDGLDDRVMSPNAMDSFENVTTRLRQIVSGLRPHMLDYGLYLALVSLVDALQDRVGDRVKIVLAVSEGESGVRYKEQVELYTYRIMQQACENALRHGQPRVLTLRGRLEAQSLQLVIEDDGKGFEWRGKGDLAKLQAEGHFGLAGMLERASIVEADLHIESSAGHGTRVEVSWRSSG